MEDRHITANRLSIDAVQALTKAKHAFLSGKPVDMEEIDQLLESFEALDLSELDDDDKKRAFWMNTYNSMTSYIIILKKIKDSVLLHPTFFSHRYMFIGGISWSLNDIEHGILRQNRRPFGSVFHQFSKHDVRKSFMVEKFDERIHFALNCGGASCPMIRVYSYEHLEDELDTAERGFLQGGIRRDTEHRILTLSKIFKWYRHDFSKRYISEEEEAHWQLHYDHYNWHI